MIIDYIEKYSSKKRIIIGIVFILFANTVALPLFPKLFSNTVIDEVLDLKFGFSLESVQNTLSLMQENGRNVYQLSTIFIDTTYALVYGFVYSFIIIFLLKKVMLYKSFKFLAITPFLISIFDLIENVGIIYFIIKFPIINATIVSWVSIINQLKWTCSFFTLLIIIVLGVKYFRQGNNMNINIK